MTKLNKKQNQIRYNLHLMIRKEGFKVNARQKTIYIPHTNLTTSLKVDRLQKYFDYTLQIEIN